MSATLWTPSATPTSCGDRSSLKRLPFNWSLSTYGASPPLVETLGRTKHRTTTRRDTLQLQRIFTETSTWTQQRLTDLTPTRRANLHAHDSLTHTLPDDDLDKTPNTAPRHHLSHQRSSSSTLPTTTPCRLLRVASPNARSPVALRTAAYSPSSPGRSADRRSPAPRR
jgi:hypothetical protein